MEVNERAPAKINIGLWVLPKKEGAKFHDIISIFQTIDLFDNLCVRSGSSAGKIEVVCDNFELPVENTLTKAFAAWGDVVGRPSLSVAVSLHKNIPDKAGLGGGSSDAASLVRALEVVNGVVLTPEQKKAIGDKVGCDVHFFLNIKEGAAVVTGYGEQVQRIKARGLNILVLDTGEKISTADAYRQIDENFKKNSKNCTYPLAQILQTVYNSPISDWSFANTFTSVASGCGAFQKALRCLSESGALYSSVTGSGGCVYGVYGSASKVQDVRHLFDKICEYKIVAVQCSFEKATDAKCSV